MRKLFSILVIFLLIGTASAAVFIAMNPEARIYFGIDKPAEVEPIITLVPMLDASGNITGWTNGVSLEMINGTIESKLAFRNPTPFDIIGNLIITVECDAGVYMENGAIKDFNSILFRDYDLVSTECNCAEMITVMTGNMVEIDTGILRTFPAEQSIGSHITIVPVGMAYGNYTVSVLVEQV